jgi:hypothetical protein
MTTAIRLVVALIIATAISALGLWAYMANIHDQATWLIFVVAISMPIAALASLRDFFDTAAVYWLSVIAGYLLWFWTDIEQLVWHFAVLRASRCRLAGAPRRRSPYLQRNDQCQRLGE